MMNFKMKVLPALVLLAIAQGAYAEGDDNSQTLDRVVVTGNRQGSQDLQTLPTSVTVVSPGTIERNGGTSLQDVAPYVPSLTLETGGPGLSKIDIRGISLGSADILNNLEDRPLVGVYIDDTPIAMQGFNPNINVLDLQQVEVLRGPQGTLYGAGTMGGTIRYVTVKPDTSGVFGSEETVLSNTQGAGLNWSQRIDLNAPITDRIAMLFTGYTGRDAGWINNIEDGQQHSNWNKPTQGRIAIRFKATDDLTIDASVLSEEESAGAANYTFSGLNKNEFASLTPTPINDNLKVYNVTAEDRTTYGKLIVSTSFEKRDNGFNDSGQYFTSAFYPTMPNPSPATYLNQNSTNQFSEEVRFVSNQDQPFRWIVGAFYNKMTRQNIQDDNSPGFDAIEGVNSVALGAFNPNSIFSGNINIHEHDQGLFGETNLDLTDRLTLTTGLRYFDWHQSFNVYFAGEGGDVNGAPSTVNQSTGANGVDPRIILSYKLTPNTIVFGEVAKGFRYGGVNEPVPNGPPPLCHNDLVSAGFPNGAPASFGPDSLWSYSLGEKSALLDDRLHVNATAFIIDWNNLQTSHYLPVCSYTFTENAGKAQSTGGELEVTYKLTHNLTLGMNGSFTRSVSDGPITNVGALSGEQVPYVPRFLANLTADYTVGPMRYDAEYQFHGSSGTRFNPADPEYRTLPSYTNVNISATYTMKDWEFGIFAKNLFNTSQVTMLLPDVLGSQPGDETAFAAPRTIGVRAVYSF